MSSPKSKLKAPQAHQDDNKGQSRMNLEVTAAIRALQQHPFAGGHVLPRTSIGITETRVAHKMGKTPQGWFPMSLDTNTAIRQTKAPDAEYLYLQAGSAASCLLFVF